MTKKTITFFANVMFLCYICTKIRIGSTLNHKRQENSLR